MTSQPKKQQCVGKVVSNSSKDTIKVLIEELYRHPIYRKVIRRSKNILAHCTQPVAVGDKVQLVSCRPISKRKSWRLLSVVDSSKVTKG